MAAFSLTTRLLGKSLHGTTIRHNATATPSSRTSPSLLAHLEPSQLMHLASPRIASMLSSFADDDASSSTRTDSNASPRGRDEDNHEDDDAAFSPYFRRGTHETAATATTASAAAATAVNIQPLLTRQELREWQTPHMPLFTPKQLEATLLEIQRRQRHRRRERERQKSASDSSASSFSDGSDENDMNHTMQQQQNQLDSKKREAAILLPLCTVRGTPSVLFTRRSAELSSHASQISFPGGYFDEKLDTLEDMEDCGKHHENELAKRMDRRLVHTAVREMHEELCFDLEDVEFFGNRGYFEYCDNDSSSSIASGNNNNGNNYNTDNDNNIENDKTGKFNNTPRKGQSPFPTYQQQQTQTITNNTTTNIKPKPKTTTTQPPPFLTILGQTQPVPQMSGHKVTPIIATINYDLPPPTSPAFHALFPGNPEEVDWIFTVPIVELMKGETSEPLRRWSRGDTARYGGKYEVWGPVFPVPDGVACYREEDEDGDIAEDGKDDGEEEKRRLWKKREGDKVWGLTASVLRPILYKVLIPVFGEEGLGLVGKVKESNGGVSSKL